MISSHPMARRVRRPRLPGPMFVLVLAGALAGCGPIVYGSEVAYHASDAVDAARAAHADQYAPYWWTRATQYLAKAREIAAYADFQGANRFGRLATEAATRALEEAQRAAQDPSRRPLDEAPDAAPAKDPGDARPAPAAPAKDSPGSGAAPARRPAGTAAPAKDAP